MKATVWFADNFDYRGKWTTEEFVKVGEYENPSEDDRVREAQQYIAEINSLFELQCMDCGFDPLGSDNEADAFFGKHLQVYVVVYGE